MSESAEAGSAFWSLSAEALGASLGSGPAGLSSARAAELLASVGPNTVEDSPRLGALRLFTRQFANPLVLILVFAAVVSLALRQYVDASIVLAIIAGSSLLSFLQEYRASAAMQELRGRLALQARLLRDGAERTVPARDIVPGDVVVLSAGNLIPADGLVLEAADFLVSEAGMTGESFPVEKRPGVVPADAPVAGRSNSVFLGASVRSGTARVLAVNTGRRTEFGAIAARLRARPPETDFARGVRHFGYLLVRVMIVIVMFVLTINLLMGRPLIESLLFAVALAVGMSPELLPAIVSVTLAAGARAMSRKGVLVRRLEAIESLGGMNVLCTDKTGTLTAGTIVLRDAVGPDGAADPQVRQLAFLNAAFESGIDNPIDAALVAAGKDAHLTTDGYTKVDEIPYDFTRRRLTIVVAGGGGASDQRLLVSKGAFDEILAICTEIADAGGTRPLDAAARAGLEALSAARGAEGYRVLAVATRTMPAKADFTRDDEREMTFRGLLVLYDPPKADAGPTIKQLARLGIRIKIISGDNRHVTAHLAREIGLDPKSMLTGAQLAAMGDEALWHSAPRTDLFVEIDPQQKEQIVRALQRTGNSVGYLGDGINDAPALHAADVGISVEGAVDIARESADIILLQQDLGVLREGVEHGRRTFANTLKYITITTSANFGNMVSMAIAAPLLPYLPLIAKQILLNNFLSDLPSMAISTDNVDADRVVKPQRWSIADIRRYMIVFGLTSSVFDVITFATLLLVFRASEPLFQTAWFMVSVLTELAVVLVLRTRGPAFASRPSRLLALSTAAVVLVALAIPYLGEASRLFGFEPLPLVVLLAMLAIVVGYVATTEGVKLWLPGLRARRSARTRRKPRRA